MGHPGGLELIKTLVSRKKYRFSEKIELRLEEGFYALEDIEHCICNGCVYKTEKDEFKNSVGNKKYVIVGRDSHGYAFYTVGKIIKPEQDKLYFLITAGTREGG